MLADGFAEVEKDIFMHRCQPLVAAPLGIGTCGFLLGFTRLVQRFAVSRALLTGTCGIYPGAVDEFPLGSLFSPSLSCLGAAAVAQDQGYVPDVVAQEFALHPGEWQQHGGVGSGRCLTLTAITADDLLAEQLGAYYRAVAEQMECFAFAAACHAYGISGSALFAVSNVVGRDGHVQWRSTHARVVEKSAACIRTALADS